MKNFGNQRGYALLIVMLTIIIFLSLSAVFVQTSLSHVTQEQTVDVKNQAVVAAEMGVKFVQMKFENEYIRQTPILLNLAQAMTNSFYNEVNIGERDRSDLEQLKIQIREEIANNLYNSLNNISEEIEAKEEPIDVNTKYEITSCLLANSNTQIDINCLVSGEVNDKISKMNIEIILPTPELQLTETLTTSPPLEESGSDEGNNTAFVPPAFHAMLPDSSQMQNCNNMYINTECKSSNSVNLDRIKNSEVYFNNYYNLINHSGDLNNSIIYNYGHFMVKSLMGISNTSFYIHGTFSANQFKGLDNVYLQLNGSMSISGNSVGQGGIQNSVLYLNGALMGDHIDMRNSLLRAIGSVHINGKVDLVNNSNVCVDGDLQIDKKVDLDSTSNIYYTNTISPESLKSQTNIHKINSSDLNKYCKVTNPNFVEPEEDIDLPIYDSKVENNLLGTPIYNVKY